MKTLVKQTCHRLLQLCVVALLAMSYTSAHAVGTAAGSNVSNTANVTYTQGGTNFNINSNTVVFQVDEKLDVNVTWQDAANVGVNTPDADRVLTYLLTNTGNGNDSYLLTVNNLVGGDQFNPVLVNLYLDANDNGIYDAGVDTLYNPGGNDPSLNADESLAIFVLNNIPAGLTAADLGNSELTATSNTGSGAPGTPIIGGGDSGSDAVVGTSGGTSTATGVYEVSSVNVSIVKSVVINDLLGGNQPTPGATLTYTLTVTVTGTGTATGIVISDPIPADTTYSAGTLTLNAAALTDVVDADAGDVGGTAANTVTVNLGDMTPASPAQTITFDVIIN